MKNIFRQLLWTDTKKGIVDYPQVCKNARSRIYQSVNSSFDYVAEYAKDNWYRDVPAGDSRMFIIKATDCRSEIADV